MADHPTCVFGNFVNEQMVHVPDERHARALIAVSPRKVWLADPGDVLVLPTDPPGEFWAYAHDLLGMTPGDVEVISVDSGPLLPLATRMRELGLVGRLRDALTARPGVRGVPFALDRPTLELFGEIGLPVDGYDGGHVPASALETAYRLNTKSGFRELAARSGIPVAPGTSCPDRVALRAATRELAARGRGAVVKLDRSSNGFALLFLRPGDDVDAVLDAHLAGLDAQPEGWVVEEFLDIDSILTVEMWSHEDGPELVHTGQMITPNGSFSGQLTPPRDWSDHLDVLGEYGLHWGRHLHEAGYRGPFDLDAVTAGGELFVTETNVRRTGTTYLEHLVRRLARPSTPPTWLADSRVGERDLGFAEAVAALQAAGIAYEAGTGVVLTADTRALDRKWRFLVLGGDHDDVGALEKQLVDVLSLV